jgi:hypothetical protein
MKLTCYTLDGVEPWPLEPAPVARQWMNSASRGAYRCLPLTMANHAGWIIRCPAQFDVHWNGGDASEDMAIYFAPEYAAYAPHILSHFGHGVVTFSFPMLFRTESSESRVTSSETRNSQLETRNSLLETRTSLRVAGMPNEPKYNCTPLEGIVETWWCPFTFTMNWRLQKPFIPVRFEAGEPICFIQPISLDLVGNCVTAIRPLATNPSLQSEYVEWAQSRDGFNKTNDDPKAWQKKYHQGAEYTSLSLGAFA